MATKKQATDTTPAAQTSTPSAKPKTVKRDSNYKRVRVRSKATGAIHPGTVPATWLDGRFPDLVEVPSSRKDNGRG